MDKINAENENEVKILTFYKQHYRNQYDQPLDSQFSCLGYFDGLSIYNQRSELAERLYEKRTHSPISTMWYETEKISLEDCGRFSMQIIGIFRQLHPRERAFSDFRLEESPYLIVCFLQTEDSSMEMDVYKHIEENYSLRERDSYVFTNAYLTFDNTSIVCILSGNSVKLLNRQLLRLEGQSEISSSHSIFCIREEYLKKCSGSVVSPMFCSRSTHIDDGISLISLRISLSRNREFMLKFYKQLKDILLAEDTGKGSSSKPDFYYRQEHMNAVVVIKNTKVKTLISLLVSGGFCTHQNPLYSKGLIGIETSFSVGDDMDKQKSYGDDSLEQTDVEKRKKYNTNKANMVSWAEKEIGRYRQYALEAAARGKESLYASYIGVIRTLNAVSQYENYSIGKDLFYIIYPSFSLFDYLLSEAKKEGIEPGQGMIFEEIKNQINDYITQVNEVLYHTIHNDQLYFMIPGYSGISYAISQKLLMFYHWFCRSVIDVLNDGKRHRYEVLISPVMEEVAQAYFLNFKTHSRDRALCVKISQRVMSFPRNNMIVLCHEIGHYVGDSMRSRKERVFLLCEAAGYLISDFLWIDSCNIQWKSRRVARLYNSVKAELHKASVICCSKSLAARFSRGSDDTRYYFGEISREMLVASKQWILEEKDNVWEKGVSDISMFTKDLDIEEKEEFLAAYHCLDKAERQNRIRLLAGNKFDEMLEFIITMFREVYADVTTFCILGCSYQDFRESLMVSEGQIIPDGLQDKQVKLRLDIARSMWASEYEELSLDKSLENIEINNYSELTKEFYRKIWLWKILRKYAKLCKKRLSFEATRHSDIIDDICEMYKIFSSTDQSNLSSEDIYWKIQKKNEQYRGNVEKMRKEDLTSNK